MKLSNLTPMMSMLVTVVALVAIGILKQTGLLDGDLASVIVSFILGGGSGVALRAGFGERTG